MCGGAATQYNTTAVHNKLTNTVPRVLRLRSHMHRSQQRARALQLYSKLQHSCSAVISTASTAPHLARAALDNKEAVLAHCAGLLRVGQRGAGVCAFKVHVVPVVVVVTHPSSRAQARPQTQASTPAAAWPQRLIWPAKP